jgi:hypothetical protein
MARGASKLKSDEITEQTIIQTVQNYRHEAEDAKKARMRQNRLNFDAYHLRRNSGAKLQGQSNEFLPKQSMAVEQAANFIQQGLIDLGEWFSVEAEAGLNPDLLRVKPDEIRKLLAKQLDQINFYQIVGDAAKLGFIGSLMIFKISGRMVSKPEFVAKDELKGNTFRKILIKREDKVWELVIELVRQEDYFPDPTGRNLYEMQDSMIDAYQLRQLAEGPGAIYDKKAVELAIESSNVQTPDDRFKKARETGQNTTNHGFRNQIKLTEVWGNILGPNGELLHENVVTTIANDQHVIRKPTKNPFWHGESPFVAIPILSVPHSVWHKALMDAPTHLNYAINEMFNLMVDGGMMAVHGIKQVREDWLDSTEQVANGIAPGTTLKANSSTPPGAKVLERVDTSSVPGDGFNMFGLLSGEFNEAALTTALRQGGETFRRESATAIVEQSQALNSMFSGMVKNIETGLDKVLCKAWKVIAQNVNDLNSSTTRSLLSTQRHKVIAGMSNQELFAETVNGTRFKTFGISETLNKQRDFTKLQALLQTVSSSEVLLESFIQQGMSFGKLLEEIVKALDVNPAKLREEPGKDSGLSAEGPVSEPVANTQGGPDIQSQIPQAGAPTNQQDLTPQQGLSQAEFAQGPGGNV